MKRQRITAGTLSLLLLIGLAAISGARVVDQATTPASRQTLFNVRDFGATGDGKTSETAAIQKTIQSASAAGGGRVIFPPGTYVTGTFELLSNVTLDVQGGAVILGSTNLDDYASIGEYGFGKTYGVDSTGEGGRVGIIVARNAQNIAIVGQGVIDGNADTFYDFGKPHFGPDYEAKYTRQGSEFQKSLTETGDGPVETKVEGGRPGTMIVLSHSQNILIRDITLRNAPNWTLHLANSRQGVVNAIHILNSLLLPNNDGIDCIGCKDFHFSDCNIRAGDDDFAFYGAEGVTVSNSTLVSHSSGLRIENTRNSIFTNITMHSNRGIGIYERTGRTSDLIFANMIIDTQLMTGHWWGKAEPIFIALGPARPDGQSPEVRDVHFSNITGDVEGGVVIHGDPHSSVHNIFINQVKFSVHAPRENVSRLAGGNFDFRWTATDLAQAVFKHDIPALYGRFFDGLTIRDFTAEWGQGLPNYFSNAIEGEDFQQLDIEGLYARQAFKRSAIPVIVLRRGADVVIRESRAGQGASAFVSASDLRGRNLFIGNDLRFAKRAFGTGKQNFELIDNVFPSESEEKGIDAQ